MNDPRELNDGQAESVSNIAAHCARTNRGTTPMLTMNDRFEAALDGIIEYVHASGWPDGSLKPLFRAGSGAIGRAGDESVKHLARGHFWVEPPGHEDALAEAVTDRLGVWQVVWALTENEWAALWAVAEVMLTDGRREDAAALLGITVAALSERLSRARRKCRAAWLPPGETPRGHYYAEPGGIRSKAAAAAYRNRYRTPSAA